MKSATLKIRGGVEIDSYGKKAGKGALVQWEKSATLGVTQDQTLFVWKETDPPAKEGVIAIEMHNDREPSERFKSEDTK